MSVCAFIFARGGSKGLPKKNIMPLLGKPLIEYSIDVALNSPSIDKLFVSTDCAEIAGVSERRGAIVIDRPPELATDISAEWLSWRHAVSWVIDRYGGFSDFVSLPATSPLRSVQDVEDAIAKRRFVGADICISVTPASRSPYFNMVTIDADGLVGLVIPPSSSVIRRQDAPEVYDITTVVYALMPQYIQARSNIFGGKTTSIIIPKNRAVDIDDIYDFRFAESILQAGDI